MLFRIARASPCSALACASSPLRVTRITAPSTLACVRFGSSKLSLPLGPSTKTRGPFNSTLTFGGIATGCLPILDINRFELPNVAEEFAADVLFAGLGAGHHPAGGGHDGHAQSAEHARNLGRAHVPAQARLADAPEAYDHAFAALEFEFEFEFPRHFAFHLAVGEVALAL